MNLELSQVSETLEMMILKEAKSRNPNRKADGKRKPDSAQGQESEIQAQGGGREVEFLQSGLPEIYTHQCPERLKFLSTHCFAAGRTGEHSQMFSLIFTGPPTPAELPATSYP